MILTNEDFEGLRQMQFILSRIIKNAVMSELEEENERRFEKSINHDKDGGEAYAPPPLNMDNNRLLKFTKKEILEMPAKFKKTFVANDCIVHVRRRMRGKCGYDYEARYRRDGFNISVSSKSYDKLKPLFLEAVKKIEADNAADKVPDTFHEFAMYYFETFRKRKVKPLTYENDMYRYNNHLKTVFGSIPLKRITAAQCQHLIDGYIQKGQGRTAEEVYSLLNVILKMAIAHGIINQNPLAIVVKDKYQRKHGKALSVDEEKKLLEGTAGTRYQLLFAVALYTGLRPNEYYTARIEGEFIVAVNSKRKSNVVEYKRIPVSPMLRPFLENVEELHFPKLDYMRDKMKKILPNHILYDLRTTFNTRCQECGVSDVARKKFMGHSLGKLDEAYTDLSDNFLLSEGKKLKY